jgi:hypothetical protein
MFVTTQRGQAQATRFEALRHDAQDQWIIQHTCGTNQRT